MTKLLPWSLLLAAVLSSCVSASLNSGRTETRNRNFLNNTQPITSSFEDVDTAFIMPGNLPADTIPMSLMDLPRTEEGAFVLAPGYYEADFKTYCLQPGTPAPSGNDAYFQAPLKGARKEIIESILYNSRKESYLDQKNIQLLLWSVVSRSDYNKLSPAVQYTARQLLSPKQLFELNGGVLGMVKTVASVLPSSTGLNDLQRLFDLGVNSYEAFERLAVVSGPSEIRRPDFKRDQWYKHADGYYVRYFPKGYQQTKIQVYVPADAVPSANPGEDNYLVFDPVSMVVVPANSNAQRLGVGAPVRDIVRTVIHVIGSGKAIPRPRNPKEEKNPAPVQQ